MARGKKSPLATTAVARELVGFIWAIAHTTEPAATEGAVQLHVWRDGKEVAAVPLDRRAALGVIHDIAGALRWP